MNTRTEIEQTNPIAPYIGGKRNLSKRICAIIDQHSHEIYAEPFVGMGGIFLKRRRLPKSEFINDKNGEVYNLFRMLQEHYTAFLDMLRFQITTQRGFEILLKKDPTTLTDLQRAARFLYLQRTSFGGKVAGQNFGITPGRPARFNLTTLEPDLEAVHERLASVTVMCLDYEPFIQRIDRSSVLFYLDPPYYNNENDYGRDMFSKEDFVKLAELLSQIKGEFVMSINNVAAIREIFGAFHQLEIKTTYSLSKNSSMAAAELLISNFRID